MRWDHDKPNPKARIRHLLKRARSLATWQLLVLLLIASLVSATLLRLNNLGMNERRQAVIAADAAGDKAKMLDNMVELQRYVSSHMNTGLGKGFYLAKTYGDDRDAVLSAAANSSNPNSLVYQQASIECRARWQGNVASFRNDYVTCVIDKVSALSSEADPTANLKLPKADTYRVNYVSPLWTPDAAGIAVLACVFIILVIITRFVMLIVLRLMLRKHYQSL